MTVVFWPSVTTHGSVPLHPPPENPPNTWPAAGLAVKVTAAPLAKAADAPGQPGPQSMPAGWLVTVPLPPPAFTTMSATWSPIALNAAVTVTSAVTVT